jgi:serine/threonine-protein kinase RsbT
MMEKIKEILINGSEDIILVRQYTREMAIKLGFGLADQVIYLYARTGKILIKDLSDGDKKGIEIIAEDKGPGIPDIELAMQDGYTTSQGLGRGLPGTKRLMDYFEIKSELLKGTTVTVRLWLS